MGYHIVKVGRKFLTEGGKLSICRWRAHRFPNEGTAYLALAISGIKFKSYEIIYLTKEGNH